MIKNNFQRVKYMDTFSRTTRPTLGTDNKNQYVELLTNGRLFPTWILSNFKKYKLPEILMGSDDPCSQKNKTISERLRQYQLFVSKFLDYRSPFKDILIYHGLGSGKTATAINIYNTLYNYNSSWNVFILVKAALHKSTWLPELKKWLSEEEKEHRMRNIIFVHYDSPFANKEFIEATRTADVSKKNIYIIDECHNFIRNVYGNISTQKGKRAQEIYEHIIQDKKENDTTRVILISGTPAINTPFELALLFNLLRPNTFPKSESQFNQLFVSQTTHGEISSVYKNMFQRRIIGLVSYYIGATPDYYASQTTHYVDVQMSSYQKEVYKYFEDIEAKAALKSKGKQETYRTYTRQACNFVFPNISQNVSGEMRPRPNRFKLTEKEAEKLATTKLKVDDLTGKIMDVQGYLAALDNFMKTLEGYFDNINDDDTVKKNTIMNDVDVFHKEYKDNYDEFLSKYKNKSRLFGALYTSSPKIVNMIFNILTSKGSVLIYSNYVIMEGIQIIKLYLKYFDFTRYGDVPGKSFHRFAEYHGKIDTDLRNEYKDVFNKKQNMYGENIKIIMISPAGVEGISLNNVRQVHILEPYWHEVRITQMIGRGIRQCSHSDLPMSERHVDVYRYKSVLGKDKVTTDQYIEEAAKNKDRLINSFLTAVKEVAVDCQLNIAHNSIGHTQKCFQFDESTLFAKQIGPAYKKEIEDDIRMNNGTNSLTSITKKIKVTKIMAVKKMGEKEYSKAEPCWYNRETGTVYDYDLHYAFGKIAYDKQEIPLKINNDTYVIDKVIPIPIIK